MRQNAMNSRQWWEEYFVEDWDAHGGSEQTRHFMHRLLAELLTTETVFLRSKRLAILDWGCAFGEGVELLAQAFPQSRVLGLDFASRAIEEARKRHPNREFILANDGEIPNKFDVIITSNCLEHYEHPLEMMKTHLRSCRKLYIALVPYDEFPLSEYHCFQFKDESFPERLGSFVQLYSKRIDIEPLYWNGQQLLVVYGSQSYLKERAEFEHKALEQEKWDKYYASLPLVEPDEATQVFGAELVERVLELLPTGGRILEAGCGGGWQSLALAGSGKFQVSLMDFSREALQYAQRLFEREKLSAEFIYGDVFTPGEPQFDLVFNAGVLEHYTLEEQAEFLRGMASRSQKYVLALVPNRLCYWYWLWRIQKCANGEWPFGKEVPLADFSLAFQAAGLQFLGQTFMGQRWADYFITEIAGADQQLSKKILEVHSSPFIPREQKSYLVAGLGTVLRRKQQPLSVWMPSPMPEDMDKAEMHAALADALALRIGSEQKLNQLQARESEKEQAVQKLSAQVVEKEQSVQSLSFKVGEKEQAIQVLSSEAAEKEQAIQTLSSEAAQKEQATQKLSSEAAQKELVVQTLSSALADALALRVGSEQKLSQLEMQLSEREQTVQMLSAQVAAQEQTVQSTSLELAEKEQTIQTLTAEAAQKELVVQTLSSEAAQKEQTIQTLTAEGAQKELVVQTLTAEAAQKEQTIQTLTAEGAQKELLVQTLSSEAAQKEQTIQTLTAEAAQKEQTIQTLTAEGAQKELLVQTLSSEAAQKEQTIQTLTAEAAQKELVVQTLSSSLADALALRVGAEQRLSQLETRLSEKEQTVQMLSARVAAKEQSVQSISLELAEKDQTLRALSLEVAEKGQEIQALLSEIAEKDQAVQMSFEALAAKEAELAKITKTLGWRWLTRYGRIKYRYLLPVYRALGLPPFDKKTANDTQRNHVPLDQWAEQGQATSPVPDSVGPTQAFTAEPVPQEQPYISNDSNAHDIVCFPIIDWDFRFQRPQQMMSRFAAAGHRVFYVAQSFYSSGPAYTIQEKRANIYEISLRGPGRNVYSDVLDDKARDELFASLDSLRRDLSLGATVAFTQLPFWWPLVEKVRDQFGWPMVYDCMDHHAGFSTNKQTMVDQERNLLSSADLVVVTSEFLQTQARQHNSNVLLVPNACDYEHFSKAGESQNERPVIGYYGAIADWFDSDLVADLVQRRPDWDFVLVGSTFSADISRLSKLPNVSLPGEKHYSEIPDWLSKFDVAIIPFRRNALTEATNPVKLYEILASGKPVISVPIPEVASLAPLVRLASTAEEFEDEIATALSEDDPDLVEKRRAFAQEHTWEKRHEMLVPAIRDVFPKASIIIVTFNNVNLNRLCLESLYARTEWPNFEVIVVDNASADGTPQYLAEAKEALPNLRVILNDENLGFAAANNIGLKQATGQYLVLLNNDTVLTRGWLSALIRHLHADPEIGMIGPVTNEIGNEAKVSVGYTRLDEMPLWAASYVRENDNRSFPIPMLAMFCVALRREVFERVGLLDESFEIGMFEDDDYAHRVRENGYDVVCADDCFIHHFGRASFKMLSDERYREIFERNRTIYETKWGSWQPHMSR